MTEYVRSECVCVCVCVTFGRSSHVLGYDIWYDMWIDINYLHHDIISL